MLIHTLPISPLNAAALEEALKAAPSRERQNGKEPAFLMVGMVGIEPAPHVPNVVRYQTALHSD
jgi:hypothetical protein